jgi:hypothetical protein
MAQQIAKNKPLYVVTDRSAKFLTENEALYLKNYRTTFNANKTEGAPVEGGNFGKGTPNRANKKYALITLPAGDNLTIGVYECEETNEIYFANWNSNNMHGWYRIDGVTLKPDIIIIDPKLNFSNNPAFKIPAHRISIRVTYKRDASHTRLIDEKALIYTDGNQWQGFINVEAAVKSNGFNPDDFPYWKLRPPHFDREELLQLAVRPPMFAPELSPVPPVPSDFGKPNYFIDKSIQVAYQYVLTDGRPTTSSPYSSPIALKQNVCDPNNTNQPRCYTAKFNAGSALVERIKVFLKPCGADWYLYDIIERFGTGPTNNSYWLREDQWADYSYNEVDNTISYQICGDRQLDIVDQDDFNSFQSDLPLISIGMSAAGDSIILGDNLYNYNNLPKLDISKFKASVVDASVDTLVKTRKITIYAYVAMDGSYNQFNWKDGEDQVRFGGVLYSFPNGSNIPQDITLSHPDADFFNANFIDGNTGFQAYLAGTPYTAVSTQCIMNSDGSLLNIDVVDAKKGDQVALIKNAASVLGYVLHKFEFIVPAGKYIARICSHKANYKSEYEKTSTWVMGLVSKVKINGVSGVDLTGTDPNEIGRINRRLDTVDKEMEINVCNSDWDSLTTPDKNYFYIYAPQRLFGKGIIVRKDIRFIDGYVYEKEGNSVPIENLGYISKPNGYDGQPQYLRYGFTTDHNGFYFLYMGARHAMNGEVIFSGIANCNAFAKIAETHINRKNVTIYARYNVSLFDNLGGFGECNRVKIRGKIINQISGLGYSGVGVTSTRGATTYSSTDGSYELIVHEGSLGDRKDRIYINSGNSNGCFIIPDNESCGTIFNYDMLLAPCVKCLPRIYPVEFNVNMKTVVDASNSLKDGGSYGVGCAVFDLAGRATFIQEFNSVDVPTFMEKKSITLPGLQVELLNDIVFDDASRYITFFRTKNKKLQKYIQWVGDKIEFLDKDGEVTNTGAGAIRARITIQSLLDFNTNNNFSTTATYQFSKGDIVRFYDDGKGNLFDPTNGGLMDYLVLGTNFNDSVPEGSLSIAKTDTATNTTTTTTTKTTDTGDGKTLIIPFDKRLLALNNIIDGSDSNELAGCGFWIEIQTPKDTSQIDGYCEIIGTYPIIDNRLSAQVFNLDTFDTYYQSRAFHIKQCTGKAIIHPFASLSVSDYFGLGCDSCGRKLVKDSQAVQKWYPGDVIKSDEFVNEGRINGLGRFRGTNRKEYKVHDMGGIVAIHAQNKQVVFICENNWFMANYDLNIIQVSDQGLIVPAPDQILGEPFQKVNNRYGCALEDTGTVVINDMDGVVFWIDGKNEAIVAMDYKNAVDISNIDNKSYFTNKFTLIRQHNQLLAADKYVRNLFDKSMAFDYKMKELHVSFRPRNELTSDAQYFANTERGVLYTAPETFTFSLDQKRWTQFQTFVPEFYGTLRKSFTGNELISFVAGIPYFHNSIDVDTFNQFYGVSDSQVIEIPFTSGDKDKTYQSLIVQSPDLKYFVDRIRTNRPRMFSYIPASHWRRKNNSWYASVLRDMSSYPDTLHPVVSMLLDGGAKISGEYCIVRFVRDLERMNEYNEVDAIFMQFIGFEKAK